MAIAAADRSRVAGDGAEHLELLCPSGPGCLADVGDAVKSQLATQLGQRGGMAVGADAAGEALGQAVDEAGAGVALSIIVPEHHRERRAEALRHQHAPDRIIGQAELAGFQREDGRMHGTEVEAIVRGAGRLLPRMLKHRITTEHPLGADGLEHREGVAEGIRAPGHQRRKRTVGPLVLLGVDSKCLEELGLAPGSGREDEAAARTALTAEPEGGTGDAGSGLDHVDTMPGLLEPDPVEARLLGTHRVGTLSREQMCDTRRAGEDALLDARVEHEGGSVRAVAVDDRPQVRRHAGFHEQLMERDLDRPTVLVGLGDDRVAAGQ